MKKYIQNSTLNSKVSKFMVILYSWKYVHTFFYYRIIHTIITLLHCMNIIITCFIFLLRGFSDIEVQSGKPTGNSLYHRKSNLWLLINNYTTYICFWWIITYDHRSYHVAVSSVYENFLFWDLSFNEMIWTVFYLFLFVGCCSHYADLLNFS